jgi:hypothetical protein
VNPDGTGRPATFRCADTARDRDDPLIGTAPTPTAFLLVEHPGPWRFDALAGAGWSPEVTAALTSAVRATRARLLVIRRPGRRSTQGARRWAVVRVGVGTHWGSWQQEADLLAAADALQAPQNPASLSPRPVLLVCAHGVHDACCAIRGRPVAAALAERWPEETWECSHVGGDRFAANVVVVPDGTYYGGLDVDSAAQVIGNHLGGRVDVDHLRGSARWPPVAQVAVAEVHRRLGPSSADDIRPATWMALARGRWLVDVDGPGDQSRTVEVVAAVRPAALLTCAATHPSRATTYRAVAVRARSGPTV